mmetsp:Transcript_33787/g.52643  ORF Transcript_33787/g.52643 Transcript_33787/m.52643 type:complete len:220 (+) Transcript_33787:857-1516(+)
MCFLYRNIKHEASKSMKTLTEVPVTSFVFVFQPKPTVILPSTLIGTSKISLRSIIIEPVRERAFFFFFFFFFFSGSSFFSSSIASSFSSSSNIALIFARSASFCSSSSFRLSSSSLRTCSSPTFLIRAKRSASSFFLFSSSALRLISRSSASRFFPFIILHHVCRSLADFLLLTKSLRRKAMRSQGWRSNTAPLASTKCPRAETIFHHCWSFTIICVKA